MGHLNVLNVISAFVLTGLTVQVLLNIFRRSTLLTIRPEFSFILSLLLFPGIIFLSPEKIEMLCFMPWNLIETSHSFGTVQVLFAVLAMFCPILIHLMAVLALVLERRLIKWQLRRNTFPTVIQTVRAPIIESLQEFGEGNFHNEK